MPFGMAMHVYGVKEQAWWPSPLNMVFNIPDAATNLLGNPLHIMLSKCFYTTLMVSYAHPTMATMNTASNRMVSKVNAAAK